MLISTRPGWDLAPSPVLHRRAPCLNQARHSGARASANLRCVITHEGISATTSGFRVRRSASPRNDDLEMTAMTSCTNGNLPGGQIKFDSSICEVQYFGEKHIGSHPTQIKSITRAILSQR